MKTLLLTIDALRVDHLAQYGYERNTMPVLDRLIDESSFYTNCFTNGTHTKLSIPSFMTSKLNGAKNIKSGPTIASALKKHGVKTAGFHSNTAMIHHFGEVAGFSHYQDFTNEDSWDVSEDNTSIKRLLDSVIDYADEKLPKQSRVRSFSRKILPLGIQHTQTPYINAESLNQQVLKWVRANREDDFFLWVHYMDPHRPYGITPTNPEFSEDVSYEEIRYLMSKASKQPKEVTANERETIINLYDSDIYYLSDQIGHLISELNSEGVWNELNFFLCADHGEEFGEHGYYFHGNKPYDELIRTPLLHKAPNVKPTTRHSLHSLLELGPTILDHHGVDTPGDFEGEPITESNNQDHITIVGKDPDTDTPSVSIRTNNKKLIKTGKEIELYDLNNDGKEQKDISDMEPSTVQELEQLMSQYLFEVDPSHPEPGSVTGDTRERLEDLGYLE